MRGSYTGRCHGPVLHYTEKAYLSSLFKSLNKTVSHVVTDIESRRQLQVERNKQYVSSKPRSKAHRSDTDKDYGLRLQKPDLPQDVYDQFVEDHFEKFKRNQGNRASILARMESQAQCTEWECIREEMLTASKFEDVCLIRREDTLCAKLLKQFLFYKEPARGKSREAMQYGTDNEKTAREELTQMLGTRIRLSGFFIDPDIEFLGASPDGLIDSGISELELISHKIMNPASEYLYSITEAGVIEIKCPISTRDMTVEEALQKFALFRRVFDACNSNILNKRHKHYFQVQGQLHIGRRQFCFFAMWSPFSMKVVVVIRDDYFWRNGIEPFSTSFYIDI